MKKGRLKTCIGVVLGIASVFLYALPGIAADSSTSMEDMQRELSALKAQVESMRSEMGSSKQEVQAQNEQLLASKKEFSQLSQDVKTLRQAQPEAVETLKDQIKKEMGFLPNTYNELAKKIRIGMELRTRGEFENSFHTVVAHQTDSLAGFPGVDTHLTGTQVPAGLGFGTGTGSNIGPFNRGKVGRESSHQTVVLNRVRFNVDADVNEHLRAFLQLQDSRFWGIEGGVLGFVTDQPNNRIDMHQGYMDIRKLFGRNITFRLGRQEIAWGDHRMMGDFGWSNIGFTWDGLRVMWDTERYAFEVFGAIQNHIGFRTSGDTGARGSGGSTGISLGHRTDHITLGSMFTFKKLIPKSTLQLMYLQDEDRQRRAGTAFVATQGAEINNTVNPQEMRVNDLGARLWGNVGKAIDYEAEVHGQWGEFRGQNHAAWAGVVGAGYTFDKVMWSPRIGAEFDWSPGDNDVAGSGKRDHHTFHNFYPTNHKHYGYADLMAWKNIKAYRGQIKVKPTKKLVTWVDYWYFQLDKEGDGWYNAGQALMRRAARGQKIGNDLGQEIDFTLTYSLYPNVGIMAGYSKFLAGPFIRKTSWSADPSTGTGAFNIGTTAPKSKDADTDWGFLQFTVSF